MLHQVCTYATTPILFRNLQSWHIGRTCGRIEKAGPWILGFASRADFAVDEDNIWRLCRLGQDTDTAKQ